MTTDDWVNVRLEQMTAWRDALHDENARLKVAAKEHAKQFVRLTTLLNEMTAWRDALVEQRCRDEQRLSTTSSSLRQLANNLTLKNTWETLPWVDEHEDGWSESSEDHSRHSMPSDDDEEGVDYKWCEGERGMYKVSFESDWGAPNPCPGPAQGARQAGSSES